MQSLLHGLCRKPLLARKCARDAGFHGLALAAVCSLCLCGPAFGQFGQSTWTNGTGNGLWSDAGNWDIPPNIYRFFTDAGVGPSTANANRTFNWLRVSNSTGTHQVDINGGTIAMTNNQIEIGFNATGAMEFSNGTFSAPESGSTQLRIGYANTGAATGTMTGTSTLLANMGFRNTSTVGYSEGTHNASGTLNMGASNNGSLTFAGLRAGWSSGTGTAASSMSFGDGWTFNVGTSAARGDLSLGYATTTGTASSSFTAGAGGSFTAYTNSLNIAGGANATNKTSTVDLSGIDGGFIDHSGGNGSFNIGRGDGSGSLAVGSGWTMNWNATAAYIGYDGGTGSVTGTNMTLQGAIPFLYVGVRDAAGAGGFGTLDMGGGSMGTGLTISTALRIGSTGTSTGTVKFGNGLVAMNGTADIGDGGTAGVEGLMELHGTLFTGGTSAVVNVQNSGRMNIFVNGTSSGLILDRADSAALTIADTVAAGNGILATFQANPTGFDFLGTAQNHDSVYWAIKWAGDQSSALNSFVSQGRIFWNTTGLTGGLAGATPQVFYDSDDNATYLGMYVTAVPEPGMLALAVSGLAIAGGMLLRRRG